MKEDKSSGKSEQRLPTVLVPYPGPREDPDIQDIFVYLRPETNGMLVESILFKVIEQCPAYKKSLFLSYLANVPGDFIVRNNIVEEHYSVKLHFAVHGKKAFTPFMRRKFEKWFQQDFEKADIIGSFEALHVLKKNPEELFGLWVAKRDICSVDGQSIKKIGNYFVVNYDIPALLHKNSKNTDIAVMVFRTSMPYDEFHQLVEQMRERLVQESVLAPNMPPSRVFHYSKGPFEQVLDGIGYLYDKNGNMLPVEAFSFSSFLMCRGIDADTIYGIIRNPIVQYEDHALHIHEDSIFRYTIDDTYNEAFLKLSGIRSQVLTSVHTTVPETAADEGLYI
jgi:hypothetical protein